MADTLVEITHPNLPGASAIVTHQSYVDVWQHRGWQETPPAPLEVPDPYPQYVLDAEFGGLGGVLTVETGVAEGAAFSDISKFAGVDPTGGSECTAEIQDALDFIAAAGRRAYAKGTFEINSTVAAMCSFDFRDAQFLYTGGAGVAFQVGDSSVVTNRMTFALPRVISGKGSSGGWGSVAGEIGVQLLNLQTCEVFVRGIRGFEYGLDLVGNGQGCVHNNVYLGHLENNKVNLRLRGISSGWCNQNQFYGGRLSHDSGEGSNVAGTRHIELTASTNLVNGNIWTGTSVEADTAEYQLHCTGVHNYFVNLRWEVTGGGRVYWGSGAVRNVIWGGYDAQAIVETFHASSGSGNQILSDTAKRDRGGTTVLENSSSGALPVHVVMAAGAAKAGTSPTTGWMAFLSSLEFKGKRAADNEARVILDLNNGRVYFGAGSAAPTAYLGPSGTDLAIVAAGLSFSADNTYDIGPSSLRPRYVRAGTAVVTGAAATGSRPAAATAGVGAMFFDTTLGKPIWSTGSGWVDATGASV